MFFVASKILGLLTDPFVIVGLLVLVATIAGVTGRRRTAGVVGGVTVLLIVVTNFTTLGAVMLHPLESRFSASSNPAQVDGIIVLGGGAGAAPTWTDRRWELNEAADRYAEVVALADRYPDATIVMTGGIGRLDGAGEPEADVVARFFADLGLLEGRFLFDDQSRNTAENATYTAELLKGVYQRGQHWLLVTSAFHMPRAMGLFRKAGLDVMAWPVDFRADVGHFEPSITGGRADLVALALREWAGLIAYRLSGLTDEFLPSP